jgi:hypothetical protein
MLPTLSPLLDGTVIAALVTSILSGFAFIYRKHNEKQAINRAVLGEISRLIDVINSHNDFVMGLHGLDNCPLIPFSHMVYKKQIKNIGILEAAVAANAVRFYGYVDFLNALQASKADYIGAGMGPEFTRIYLDSLKNCLKSFGTVFNDSFRKAKISLPFLTQTTTPPAPSPPALAPNVAKPGNRA